MNKPQIQLSLDLSKAEEAKLYQELKDQTSPQDRRKLVLDRLCSVNPPVEEPKKFQITWKKIVRWITALSGFLLLLVSVHFTYEFNCQAMSSFWALLLSLAIVFFTSFAFTLASYSTRAVGTLFCLLWFIGVSYSIFTAVAGQYQDFRGLLASDTEDTFVAQIDIYEERIESYKSQLSSLQQSEKNYQSILEGLDTPEKKYEYSRTWKDTTTRLDEVRANIADLTSKLDKAQDAILSLNQEKQTNKKDRTIYGWLSDILGISEGVLHFLVILFPSVFIDLVSGLVFKFAFGKHKEESND